MNVKRMFIFFIILLIGISVASASQVDDSDESGAVVSETNTLSDNNIVKDDNIAGKSSIKKDSKTITLNSTNYDEYVTNNQFNDNVNSGDTVDMQGIFYDSKYNLNVNKPVNIISSTNDAYYGSDNPTGFTITNGGSGTNITGVHFRNTHFVVRSAHNININNITVETSGVLVGSGQGVTSIREDSTNITINNSYFRSQNNLGVSTLVCAVAQNVLIENCTIEVIGFCGNMVYFTTYNVGYDTSRGYGNRNITFRNNHIIGLEAIQQSICYGLTMEGIGHTIENNIIEYDYYCLQQQAVVSNDDQVSQIIIRNNTIPLGINNIAFAQVENNTFNNIERLGNVNFTNNIVNNMNITGSGNYINNTMNSLTVNSGSSNITNNDIATYVHVKSAGNTLVNNSFDLLMGDDENNSIDNINDVITLDNYILINNSNFRDYGSRTNGIFTINNISANSYVYIDGPTFYSYVDSVVINVTGGNIYFNVKSSAINNITVNSPNITIINTNMSKAGIYATEDTKLVNSIFLTTDTIDKFILDNSTIYSANDKIIIFDSDDYENIFDSNTNTLLDNITRDSIIIIRNKTSNNTDNKYNLPIVINKKVSIISFENTVYDADITFTTGSDNSSINNITINKTLTINADNITVKDNRINNIKINNSKANLITDNRIKSDDTTIFLDNSSDNTIINNNIESTGEYSIFISDNSSNNTITNNTLKSGSDISYYSVSADFEINNIYDNHPDVFDTQITIDTPTGIVLNTPTEVNITVSYYKDVVDNGYVLIFANGVQKDNRTLTDGKASTNITFTDDGTNNIRVWYYPTQSYANTQTSKNVTAHKINTNLEFTELTSTKVGENLTVTLKVTDGNDENINEGNITLTIRNDTFTVPITDGTATTTIPVKENYMASQITAVYDGTPTRYNKTISSALTIQKGDIVINMLPTQITVSNITLTVYLTDINGNPITGTSRVRFEGQNITRSSLIAPVDAKVSYTITPKPSADFGVNITFRSSNAFENAVKEFTIPINGAENVTITLTAENTKIGENLTLNALVTDVNNNPLNDETILFHIGENTYHSTITDGQAIYTITTDETYYNSTINAEIEANYKYNGATSNNIQLEKGEVILTVTQIESDDKTQITVEVTDINNNPVTSGSICFNQEEIELTGSTITYEVASDITEDLTINITFTNNPAFNDKTEQITIEAKEIPLELKVDTTEFTVGQTATITASIYHGSDVANDINSGKVVFKINGKTLKDANGKVIYAKVTGGVATIEYQITENMNNTQIQAVYSGSAIIGSLKSDKQTITVNKAQPTLTFSDITAKKSDNIQINIQVKQAENNINTGKIVVKINGKTLKDANGKVIYAQVIDGQVTINYTIPSNMKNKDYTITAIFTSNEYERIESNQTLTITE